MKKIKSYLILLFMLAFLLSGCRKVSSIEQITNELIYIVTDGIYIMESDEEQAYPPSVTFNTEDNTFSFTFDVLSSYANIGTYIIEKDEVVATTLDGKYTFVFKIIDDNIVSFLADKSSSTKTVNGKPAVLNGTIFKLECK